MTTRAATATPAPAAPETAMPWWSAPAGLVGGFLLPLMFVIALAGEMSHPALTIRGVPMLNLHWLSLGALMLVALAMAGWIGAQVQPDRANRAPPDTAAWDRAGIVLGLLATGAFLVWFRDLILDPGTLLAILTGAFKPDRDEIELTPGLTSLANMAPVCFSIHAYRLLGRRGGEAGLGRPVAGLLHALCATLALLTLFRVYVWSERLAMIEMAAPYALALGGWMMRRDGAAWRTARAAGPFAAIPLVIVFFGVAEYGRSWASDTYQGKFGFWEFTLGRFASYYYTSLNNGAGLLATSNWPTWEFEFTLEWLHRAPFGLGRPFSEAVGYQGPRLGWYLIAYQDEEFNSPSGLFGVLSDLGVVGGVAYMTALGLAAGLCFRAYRGARLFGVLGYPMLFICFMEIYRYPYLGTPRAFTWTLGIGVALLIAASAASRDPRPRHHPGPARAAQGT